MYSLSGAFWNAARMRYVLSREKVASQIPCYELGFVPDGSVVACVRQHNTRLRE